MKFKEHRNPPALLAHRALRIAGVLALTAAASCGWMAGWQGGTEPTRPTTNRMPPTGRLIRKTVKEHYNSRFGVDQPFLPSNAVTDTGEFIKSQKLSHGQNIAAIAIRKRTLSGVRACMQNSFRAPWLRQRMSNIA